jgi:hypothetical protein
MPTDSEEVDGPDKYRGIAENLREIAREVRFDYVEPLNFAPWLMGLNGTLSGWSGRLPRAAGAGCRQRRTDQKEAKALLDDLA